jgi:hypothetical protein
MPAFVPDVLHRRGFAALLAALTLPSVAHAQCPLAWAPAANYTAGNDPANVGLGDFNADGRLDVAILNVSSGNVSIRLGTGGGAFAGTTNFAVGYSPQAIAIADLNGDDRLDLAIVGETNALSVLLGVGNGNFNAPTTYSTGNTAAYDIVLGDFNGDGRTDIAAANGSQSTFGVLLGNGNGTFQTAVTYPTGGTVCMDCVTGDFNNDGRLDLAGCHITSSNVSVRLGNGDGTFQAATLFACPGIGSLNGVRTADLNGDGRLDLALSRSHTTSNVPIMLGNGNGTFQAPVNYSAGNYPNRVAIGDVNADGRYDLVIPNSDIAGTQTSVLLGNGNGTFQAAVNLSGGTDPAGVAIGDVSGDARADIVVANFISDNFSVFLNTSPSIGITQQPVSQSVTANQNTAFSVVATGTGPFVYQWRHNGVPLVNTTRYSGVTTPTLTITSVLTSHEGSYDVVISGGCNGTNARTSSPAILCVESVPPMCLASFLTPVTFPTGTRPAAVAAGDFNNDGNPDLAVPCNTSNNVSILLGNGTGSLLPAANFSVGASPSAVAIADFNNDGNADFAAANGTASSVSVRLGNGAGGFGSSTTLAVGPTPLAIVAGDLNADGRIDLAVANQIAGNISVLLGVGTGAFLPQVTFAAGNRPNGLCIADFNLDGKPDLAAANIAGANVSVLRGTGTGSFLAPVNSPAGADPRSIATGDFNFDGRPDVVVTNVTSDRATILLGNGDGTFQPPYTRVVGSSPYSVAVGDINGDARPDVVVANNGGNVSTLLGSGDGTFEAAVNFNAGSNPFGVALTDLNGDGRLDITTANFDGNNAAVLLNVGPCIGFAPQPLSQTKNLGETAVFTASVGAGSYSYLWHKDGLPLFNGGNISGATTNTLTITNIDPTDLGTYHLQVIGGCNPAAVAHSRPAVLSGGYCPADHNKDGVVDFFDYLDFVAAFDTGC